MLDYLAYQMAQRRVADLAHGALPDNPIRPFDSAGASAHFRASGRLRMAVAAFLRYLADRCDIALSTRTQPEQGDAVHRDAMNLRPCRPVLNPIDA